MEKDEPSAPAKESGGEPGAAKGNGPNRKLLRGGVIAAAALIALVAWLATRDGGGDDGAAPAAAGPRIVSAAQLGEAAAALGQPVYWAGAVPATEIELSEPPAGGVRVRYLPQGTAAGAGSAEVLTVGSYPVADPGTALRGFAARPDAIVRHAGGGREVISSTGRPTSVYFVDPDDSVQVEVYDPSPERAMSLALSGRVRPAP